MAKKVINPATLRGHLDPSNYTIERIVYDYLNTLPKGKDNKVKATAKYNQLMVLRKTINREPAYAATSPKRAILNVCKTIAANHLYCETMLKKFGGDNFKRCEFDWVSEMTTEEAPHWKPLQENGLINLEDAITILLFKAMVPYLLDNHKKTAYDYCK